MAARGDFNDGDANAAAMAEHAAKTDAQRAKEQAAAEARLAKRVTLTLRDLLSLILALERATELAELQPLLKGEYRVRTAAINVVASNKPLIAKLKAIETATTAKERVGRRVQSSAKPKARD